MASGQRSFVRVRGGGKILLFIQQFGKQ